jgi:CBS domain-containing protein
MHTVREFMTEDVVTIESDSPIEDAARLMRQYDIGLLPVMDGDSFRGVVTDRDIVVKAIAEGRFDERIGAIVSESIVMVSPDDDVERAAELMAESDVRRLPVCEDGLLVGMVSVGDLATRADSDIAGVVMEQTGPEY